VRIRLVFCNSGTGWKNRKGIVFEKLQTHRIRTPHDRRQEKGGETQTFDGWRSNPTAQSHFLLLWRDSQTKAFEKQPSCATFFETRTIQILNESH